ncbi:alpha/beta hydrolase-fold protein [uncultured Georgenia sp.]|uniref:alpha/beta hydrolase-fold protein n=1 Tax=uncultured Georgenia sp. TaxID=378209 RepID=UPI002611AF98|nr:alpha/beta hydrolase-fold protein [uncultured Georgenia sp.]
MRTPSFRPSRHGVGSPPRPASRRRRPWELAAAVVALTALAVGGAAVSASADEPADLGPTLIRTDVAPTGYAVTFRYDAPPDVEQVHIYGDWTYAQPETITCDGCGDHRLPAQWQPGDVAATQWRTIPMVKGADGIWEVTTPLPAGTFRYAFTHDCESEVATGCTLHDDPVNRWEIQPQYAGAPGAVRSTFWVPTHPDFPTYATDYQRPLPPAQMGELQSLRYESPLSTNPPGVHDVVVYTPHGYDPDRAEPYPTLYLSHGGGDHSIAWTMQGVAHYIVQNAINEGAAEEMVVVSTDFNGLPGGNVGYVNELVDNVFPFIEENFNVSTDPHDRAFAGFSAGGSRAQTIAYDYTHLFGYHGVWSIGGGPANAEQVERMKNVSGAIMWGTGLQDRLGNIAVNSVARAAALREAGVDIVEHNVPGGHTWHSWRPLLNFFVREVIFHDPDDRSGIPLKATVSETTGALTLTVASYGDAVELGDESRLADRLTFRGALPTLTVTDSRSDEQAGGGGWSLTGQSGVFRNGSHELGAGHLGWTPRLAAAKPGVTPGAPVASVLSDGRGLAAPAALATADQTGRRGQAAVTADLLLEFPVAAPFGEYTANLSVSLFPTD